MAQYGMDDTAAIMTRFFGSMFVGSFLMAGYITFVRPNGLEASWAFFNLVFIQNICAFFFAIWSHQKNHLGVNEKTFFCRRNCCAWNIDSTKWYSLLWFS